MSEKIIFEFQDISLETYNVEMKRKLKKVRKEDPK